MSDITTKLQLRLEENLERNAALKKENRELRADLRQLQGMSNAQADFTNDDAVEIEALKSDIARHVEISSDQANEIAALKKENEELNLKLDSLEVESNEGAEIVAELRSRLSAYEEGIPVADADKCKTYISYDDEDGPSEVVWVHTKGYWMYSSDFDEVWVNSMATRLYPLPQKEKS